MADTGTTNLFSATDGYSKATGFDFDCVSHWGVPCVAFSNQGTVAGDVEVKTVKGNTIVVKNVQVGQRIDLQCTKILNASTTCSNVLVLVNAYKK